MKLNPMVELLVNPLRPFLCKDKILCYLVRVQAYKTDKMNNLIKKKFLSKNIEFNLCDKSERVLKALCKGKCDVVRFQAQRTGKINTHEIDVVSSCFLLSHREMFQ